MTDSLAPLIQLRNLFRPKVMHLSHDAEPSEPGEFALMLCGRTIRLRGGKDPKRACPECMTVALAEHQATVDNYLELKGFYEDTTDRLSEIERVLTAPGGARRD